MSKPFENVAISLSGGGYRAAAFHLGALSYLDHVLYENQPLLQRVKVISTISGGTFTGINYVLALAQGKDFKFCFHKLYRLLQQDKLVVDALEMINHTGQWKAQTKNKNLINAFSEVYQAQYCDNEHLSLLLGNPLGHLEEFCFNATDLYDSLPFRFQKTGKMGNGKMYIDFAAADEIRLGDIMAASSCFPGGFEPLAFPNDFIREKNSPLDQYWQAQGYPRDIALMDGGILDNQGIESVDLANKRRPEDKKIGTFIISDVSPRNALPFNFPALKKPGILGRLTYQVLSTSLVVLTALCIFGVWWCWNTSKILPILFILMAVFSTLFLIIGGVLRKLLVTTVADTVDQKAETPAILSNLDILKKTPLYILRRLIATRIFSLADILENTFMSRIRTLENNYLYSNEVWEHKLVSSNIYSLYTDYKATVNIPAPSAQMLATTKLAATMPTALWFTGPEKKANMLDALIISGQINLCFELLRHLQEEKPFFPPEMLPALEILEATIMADYLKFIADEKWLLKELVTAQ